MVVGFKVQDSLPDIFQGKIGSDQVLHPYLFGAIPVFTGKICWFQQVVSRVSIDSHSLQRNPPVFLIQIKGNLCLLRLKLSQIQFPPVCNSQFIQFRKHRPAERRHILPGDMVRCLLFFICQLQKFPCSSIKIIGTLINALLKLYIRPVPSSD